jgi:hypothetical protein
MKGTIHRLRRWLRQIKNKGFVYNLRKYATSADKSFDKGKSKDECPISNIQCPMMKVND